MGNPVPVFYGSYRSDRMGIRLARFVVERLRQRGEDVELMDAQAINLPMLDRMRKECPVPKPAPDRWRGWRIRSATQTGSPSSTGEYNWDVQPGLKNLTDHFLE